MGYVHVIKCQMYILCAILCQKLLNGWTDFHDHTCVMGLSLESYDYYSIP